MNINESAIKVEEIEDEIELVDKARISKRIYAKLIDFSVYCLLILSEIGVVKLSGNSESAYIGIFAIVMLALIYIYFVIIPIKTNGYTMGKKLMNIKITKINGKKVSFLTMNLRTVVTIFLCNITFGIGYLVSLSLMLMRDDKRALHDLIAGTYVRENAQRE